MDNQPTVKNVGISLPCDVLEKGKERAALFRMKFSHYLSMLIEKDWEAGKTTVTIHAKPPDSTQGMLMLATVAPLLSSAIS